MLSVMQLLEGRGRVQGVGLSALILSVVAVFAPFAGVLISGLSGLLVCFSTCKLNKYGVAAIIINLVNLFFLSPVFFIAALGESESILRSSGPSLATIFWSIVGIQFLAVIIFFATRIIRSRSNA